MSTSFILPIPTLALRQPLERRIDALLPRGVGLGVGNPLNVFALMAGAQTLKSCPSLGVSLHSKTKVRGYLERLFGRRFGAWHFGASLIELRRFADLLQNYLVAGQIPEARDPAILAHRLVQFLARAKRLHQATFPETERAVFFERRHAAEHALMHKMGTAPLDGLFDLRAAEMNQLPQPLEDRLGEVGRFFDVCIDAEILLSHVVRSKVAIGMLADLGFGIRDRASITPRPMYKLL